MEPKQWWLISDASTEQIRAHLERAAVACSAHDVRAWVDKALHELDSGLNVTDAVPGDWQVAEPERANGDR